MHHTVQRQVLLVGERASQLAAVGGGFNSYFMAKVCNAAFYLYRERFLAEKYGADVIDVTVEPADDVDPHYPEEGESLP